MAVYRPTYIDKKSGETKQSNIWWYEFIYNGERHRKSAKTTKKTLAIVAEDTYRKELENAYAGKPVETARSRIRTVKAALDAKLAPKGE